jgi:hypothetical protein
MRRSLSPRMQKDGGSLMPVFFLSLVTAACLAPFLGKAVHMDDPLFLWTARHIGTDPLNFYGFSVNWYGKQMPMFQVMKNPPAASFYIALITHFFGWKEVALHTAFLLPAIAAATGTYYMAKELCLRPAYATLAGVMTPVFLLSASTLMCDTMMLALWVWATFFWIRGIRNDSVASLAAAVILVALCSLTKYYGISLIPLLSAYALAKKRRPGIWTLLIMVPVAILAGYQLYTQSLYGRGLLTAASAYAGVHRNFRGAHLLLKTLTGLSFTGGCLIAALFYSFRLWRRRTMAASALLTAVFLSIVFPVVMQMPAPNGLALYSGNAINWPFVLQCYLFSLAGVSILGLAAADLWQNKDAEALLLFLWVAGTFVFAAYLNWSVNGRSVLPMAPVAGILIMRRIEQGKTAALAPSMRSLFLPLIPAVVIALSVTYADYSLANAGQSAATSIGRNYAGVTLWFKGHWGFQYYMEKEGGRPLDTGRTVIAPGDLLVAPSNNTNSLALPPGRFGLVGVQRVAPAGWVTTMDSSLGAGFYSDLWGPLPFAFGPVPVEKYYVFMATQ